jgi:hypothetical protein
MGRASPLPVWSVRSSGRELEWFLERERWDAGRMAKDLLDAVYGSLIGGAIGDALGALVDGWHYTDIRRGHGREERVRCCG